MTALPVNSLPFLRKPYRSVHGCREWVFLWLLEDGQVRETRGHAVQQSYQWFPAQSLIQHNNASHPLFNYYILVFRLKTNLKGHCPQLTCLKLSPHRYPSLDCASILDAPDRYTREVKKCQLQGSLLFTSVPILGTVVFDIKSPFSLHLSTSFAKCGALCDISRTALSGWEDMRLIWAE